MVAGLASEAALGLMFAPEAGTETRDKLSGSITDLGHLIKDFADVIKSKIGIPVQEAADDLEHA